MEKLGATSAPIEPTAPRNVFQIFYFIEYLIEFKNSVLEIAKSKNPKIQKFQKSKNPKIQNRTIEI